MQVSSVKIKKKTRKHEMTSSITEVKEKGCPKT